MFEFCPTCKQDLAVGETIKVRDKGAGKINDAARLRNNNIIGSTHQKVYVSCRRDYTNTKALGNIGSPVPEKKRETPKIRIYI
jgi:hypothetical protein